MNRRQILKNLSLFPFVGYLAGKHSVVAATTTKADDIYSFRYKDGCIIHDNIKPSLCSEYNFDIEKTEHWLEFNEFMPKLDNLVNYESQAYKHRHNDKNLEDYFLYRNGMKVSDIPVQWKLQSVSFQPSICAKDYTVTDNILYRLTSWT